MRWKILSSCQERSKNRERFSDCNPLSLNVSESLVMCSKCLKLCLLIIVDGLRKYGVNVDFGGLAHLLDDRIKSPNLVKIENQV